MKVKDIMTKEVVSVYLDAKVIDIARLIADKNIHGLPVVDKDDIILGIITMSDFFIKGYPEIYLPSFIDFFKNTSFHDNIDPQHKHASDKLIKAKAEDIMSKNCFTVQEEMDINDLLDRYRTSSLKTIPVINSMGKMTGIVTRSDILKLIKI